MSIGPIRVDNPDRWRGDLEGYLAWADANWKVGPGWCPRHWAPCPVEGLNGLLMSVWLMQEALTLAPRHVRRAEGRAAPAAMNGWLASLETPICCLLGDERMDELWQQAREHGEKFEKERRL